MLAVLTHRLWLVIIGAWILSGCKGPLVGAAMEPTWTACPFPTGHGVSVDCANVSVPRNWDAPNDGNIYVFVSRVRSLTAPPRNHTHWFLNGGSGVGGKCGVGSSWVEYLASQGFDVALPAFRGVGLSTPRLDCPDDPDASDVPTLRCAQHFRSTFGPNGMSNYSITQAARDLHYLLATLAPNQRNTLQGDSFGTFWLQRYLTIYPDQADGAMIESYGVSGRWHFFEAPNNLDWVARRLLQYCELTPRCGSMLAGGADTYAVATKVLRGESIKCHSRMPDRLRGEAMDPAKWKAMFRQMAVMLLGSGSREMPALLPAVIYRMGRCSPADVSALYHMAMRVTEPASPAPRDECTISQVILYNLICSESSPQFRVQSVIDGWRDLTVFTNLSNMVPVFNAWPRYPLDAYYGKVTTSKMPLLFVNGDLDVSTPWENAAYGAMMYGASETASGTRRLVRIPKAPHVAFLQSPVDNSRAPCGLQLLVRFLLNTTAPLDLSCLDHLVPLDFFNSTAMSKTVLGVADLWEFTVPLNQNDL